MGAPAKFLFDLDFSAPDRSRERAASREEIEREVAAAEARAYRNGFEAAQHEAALDNERRAAQAFADIGGAIRTIAAGFAGIELRMETEAVDVALAVARKLSGDLVAAEPLGEIVALVSDCFRHLVATPHLVVRLNDALYDRGRVELETLAKQSGFQGRLVILAEPDIAGGDCRIEWADGGVALERAAVEAKVNEMVGRYMASRNRASTASPLRMTP